MNIQMQISGICILTLLLYFYKRQGNLGLYIGKLFKLALYSTFVCLTLDILSIVLIVNQDLFPVWFVKVECKTYLASLVFMGYVALIYANADIKSLVKADKFSRRLIVVMLTVILLICVLPIHIYYDGNYVVYTYGPACYATYVGAIMLVFATLFKLIFQGKLMNLKRRNAIMLWMIIWVVAAIVQFIFSNLLLVGFASVMGMVILFFELENPEFFIDRSTGAYNNYALEELIRQRYLSGKNGCGILLSFENINEKNIPLERIEMAIAEMAQYIQQLPETVAFKISSREFFLMSERQETMEATYEVIRARFQQGWAGGNEGHPDESPIILRPFYLMVPTIMITNSVEEMLDLLKYYRSHFINTLETDTMVLDESAVRRKGSREEMIEIIRYAMKEDRVEVFFQPIYSLSKKKFVSAEALARIRLKDGGIIPPGLFIPIAEETGLIARIGEIVFDKTCRLIKETDITNHGIEYIEVNLSVVQCESRDLADNYIDIMRGYGISPEYINLEITESAAVAKKDILLENMHTLIEFGVTFSLDDFGNGQSNLNYMVDMPVQIVKFDRDMVQAYFKNPKARFVMQAVTDMAHKMQLQIVAEGIETAEQLNEFENLGVDDIQGYYFSRPLEAEAFLDFIREKNQTV